MKIGNTWILSLKILTNSRLIHLHRIIKFSILLWNDTIDVSTAYQISIHILSHFDIESIELKYNQSLARKILFFPFTLDLYFPILEMKKKKKKSQRKRMEWICFVLTRRRNNTHKSGHVEESLDVTSDDTMRERKVVAARKALSATKATFERTGVPVKRQSRCDIECPDCLPLLSLPLFPSIHPFFSDGRPKCHSRVPNVTLVVNE